MEGLDYWRLCDELNIIQAALLISGEDPSSAQAYVEGWEIDKRPPGYEAAKAALTRWCLNNVLACNLVNERHVDTDGYLREPIEGTVNISETTIEVTELKTWLSARGFNTGFFFPQHLDTPGYLDKEHPRYAPKLAASLSAWMSFEGESDLSGRHPKQGLLRWLRENGAAFGLTNEDGIANEKGIEECAKVANWQERGGAPKTPTANPTPQKG